ncbi:AC4 protein [Tomato leaf curl Joydebpur virus-[Kalyani]]|nr:AC4 protein [Tomato leaf curl Joydebpur virus-[Kalyani]]
MGNLIYTCSSNLREKFQCKITDSSTSFPQPGQHISIRTFRELRALQMSKPMWRKTETSLILEFSKSMADQLEEVSSLPTTHMPRQSIQGPKLRPSIF